jgi:hypothetical protein
MAPHTIRGDLHYYNGESGFCQDEKLRFAAFVPASLQHCFIITSALLQHYFSITSAGRFSGAGLQKIK